MISISIAIFCVAASAVIFSRSIELIANMGYTNHVEAGILIGIASLLIWIVILGADSAEHILKAGFKKAGNLQQGVNDE
tara:strand:- start:66 stop:302 length:237 start_codon:yes stop_codon:yes gene_type:complete